LGLGGEVDGSYDGEHDLVPEVLADTGKVGEDGDGVFF
jgi:hypothetical protein